MVTSKQQTSVDGGCASTAVARARKENTTTPLTAHRGAPASTSHQVFRNVNHIDSFRFVLERRISRQQQCLERHLKRAIPTILKLFLYFDITGEILRHHI